MPARKIFSHLFQYKIVHIPSIISLVQGNMPHFSSVMVLVALAVCLLSFICHLNALPSSRSYGVDRSSSSSSFASRSSQRTSGHDIEEELGRALASLRHIIALTEDDGALTSRDEQRKKRVKDWDPDLEEPYFPEWVYRPPKKYNRK